MKMKTPYLVIGSLILCFSLYLLAIAIAGNTDTSNRLRNLQHSLRKPPRPEPYRIGPGCCNLLCWKNNQIIVTTSSDPRLLVLSPPTFYTATGFLGVTLVAVSALLLRRKRLYAEILETP